ncbi:hypothetical protein [Fodinicola feengrottensis]|uniref:hypothetical protein n=1 Tax=Fodinicola feengrottensis TaxID=435914 RepID=UPI0013D72C76|nr:hypothetical protein [Fodinicola feengrottensis]
MISSKLESRYRLLLLAYPRHHRRRRGEEILTTLIDGADPGRERLRFAEVFDIVRGATKVRFGGGGKIAVFLAVFAALIGGFAGMCLGSWAGWQSAPRIPDQVPAEVAQLAFPGLSGSDVWYQPYPYGFRLGADERVSLAERVFGTTNDLDGPQTAHYFFPSVDNLSLTQTRALSAAAVVRLRRAGWQIDGGGSPLSTRDGIAATRDGVVADINYGPTYATQVEVAMAGPSQTAIVVCSLVGVLIGLGMGWIVGAWAVRRLRRTGAGSRALMGVLFAFACIGLLPAALGATDTGGRPLWMFLQYFLFQPGIDLAALLIAVILVRAWRAGLAESVTDPERLSTS